MTMQCTLCGSTAHDTPYCPGRDDRKLVITLPYPISANRYWRPVNLGKHISIVPTKEAKAYKAEVAAMARRAGVSSPLTGRVFMHVQLYPNRPQDWKTRQRKLGEAWDDSVMCMDLGNCEKVLSDALNGVAWVDDKQHRRILLERMEPDEHGARVVVTITALPKRVSGQASLLEVAA